jgi:hypothetical protein
MWKKLSILFMACIYTSLITAQTAGTLTVQVTTSSTGGDYEPRNVVAIWIEDTSGAFVKTLLAYANARRTHLNTWQAATTSAGSEYNTTDAVTGATQPSHGTRTCQWNGTNFNGTLTPDGDYNVRMELTDKNETGNTASITFTKGTADQSLTPANVPSFSSISVVWDPLATAVDPDVTQSNTFLVYPNPGTGQFTVLGEGITGLEVKDLSGKTVASSTTPLVDLTALPKGVYLISIQTDKQTVIQKIVKE